MSSRRAQKVGFDPALPPPAEFAASEGGREEWKLRVQLANAYAILAANGWTHNVYNHITVRLPDCCATGATLFLINAFGCRYDEVTPASLHTVDLEGTIVRRGAAVAGVPDKGILLAGFIIHSAIHSGRSDVHAIFHTHHPDAVALSALECGLLPVSQESCLALAVHSSTRHPFEGTATDPAERQRLIDSLGPTAMTMTLENHGVVACGRTIPEALRYLWIHQIACTFQLRALAAAGGDASRLKLPPQSVVDGAMAREMKQQDDASLGQLEFDAWLRGGPC